MSHNTSQENGTNHPSQVSGSGMELTTTSQSGHPTTTSGERGLTDTHMLYNFDRATQTETDANDPGNFDQTDFGTVGKSVPQASGLNRSSSYDETDDSGIGEWIVNVYESKLVRLLLTAGGGALLGTGAVYAMGVAEIALTGATIATFTVASLAALTAGKTIKYLPAARSRSLIVREMSTGVQVYNQSEQISTSEAAKDLIKMPGFWSTLGFILLLLACYQGKTAVDVVTSSPTSTRTTTPTATLTQREIIANRTPTPTATITPTATRVVIEYTSTPPKKQPTPAKIK